MWPCGIAWTWGCWVVQDYDHHRFRQGRQFWWWGALLASEGRQWVAWAGGVREGLHAQVGQGAGAQGGSAALSLCTWRRCLDAVPFGSSLRRGSCQ